jgi:S1-C subfamily serine protease/pSer/pThr/pTyr-binding forkhead associated (FHA) protein
MRRNSTILFTFIFTLCVLPFLKASAQQVSDGQKLALYTKPSVVRIVDGYVGTAYWPNNNKLYQLSYIGSGSGAFIDPNGYIATNAHVTDLTHQGEDKGKNLLFIEFVKQLAADYGKDPRAILNDASAIYQIRQTFQPREFKQIHHVITPDGSVFPFEIKAFGAPVGEGKDVSIIKIEVKNAPVLKLGKSDNVQLQDHITVVGYPAAADTDVLDKKSQLEASITDGKVSARKNAQDGSPVLQVSAPATHGNSGGPVLNDKGEVIGMLTFRGDTVNGQEVSGFSFVVPASTMLEFVKQAGASNQEGAVDKAYREGLELYWKHEYTAAIKKFETVKALYPQHSEAEKLTRDSQQAIAEGKESSGSGGIVVILGLLFLLALAGGGVFVFVKMKKTANPHSTGGQNGLQNNWQQPYQPQPSLQMPQSQSFVQPQTMIGFSAPAQTAQPQARQAVMQASMAQPANEFAKTAMLSASAPVMAKSSTAKIGFGAIVWTKGLLAGQRFEVRPEGMYIGRDNQIAQVVIEDAQVSGRHLWIGVREGQVVVVDSGSTNGTFLNAIAAGRVNEVRLNAGDTIILSEQDVARFVYQK